MNNLYTEWNVRKKVTMKDTAVKFGVIAVILAIAAVGVLTMNMIMIVLAVFGGVAAYSFLPRLNVMYEYVFCDGQLDFDKIMGGERRKHVYRLDFEHVLLMAPANSSELQSYRQNGVKVLDFTSLEPDRKVFGIVENKGELQTLVLFEPNEKMISYIKQKAPRKIREY